MKFAKHIFICNNQRPSISEKLSCGEAHGLELVARFKKVLNDRQLPIKVRVQKTGCLDICNHGPTLVVYPDGIFYVGVQLSDVDEIIEQHIVNNKPVERLILHPSKY